jgi:hypothetical protein
MYSDLCALGDKLALRQVCLRGKLTSIRWKSRSSETDSVQLCNERAATWPRLDGPFFPSVPILHVVKNRTWSQTWESLRMLD